MAMMWGLMSRIVALIYNDLFDVRVPAFVFANVEKGSVDLQGMVLCVEVWLQCTSTFLLCKLLFTLAFLLLLLFSLFGSQSRLIIKSTIISWINRLISSISSNLNIVLDAILAVSKALNMHEI